MQKSDFANYLNRKSLRVNKVLQFLLKFNKNVFPFLRWNVTCGPGQLLYYSIQEHMIHGDLTESGECRDFLAVGRPSCGTTLQSCGSYEDFQTAYPLDGFEWNGYLPVEFRSNNQFHDRGFLIHAVCTYHSNRLVTPTVGCRTSISRLDIGNNVIGLCCT